MSDTGIQTVPGVGPGEGTVAGGTTAFGTAAKPGIVGEWLINVRRGSDLQTVAEVDDFNRAELVFRFNDVGAWVLELPVDTNAATHLLQSRAGIVVYRGSTLVFSGPVTKRRRRWNADEDVLVASGWSDLAWLVWRLAHPQPTTSAPPYSVNEYDVITAAAADAIRSYVDRNLGASALAPRRLSPAITLAAASGIGESVTGEGRWQPVLELAQKLATKAGNVAFDLQQSGTSLVFSTGQIVDRSASIRFSQEMGNLLEFDYEVPIPEANYLYSGGQGEGTARTIIEVADATSIAEHGRIERFRDARNHDTAATQTQDANEQLEELAGPVSLDLKVRDLAQIDRKSVV